MKYGSDLERLRELPLRTRITIGAVLVDRIERLYSEYFRRTFLQEKSLRIVSDFINRKPVSPRRLQGIYDKLSTVINQANEEHYDFHEVWMPGFLVEEIMTPDGNAIMGSLCAAGIGFQSQVMYRLGLSSADHRLSKHIELVDSLEEPVYDAARQAITIAEEIPEAEITLKHFSSITLPDPSDHSIIPQVILDIAKKGPTKGFPPPIHEGLGRGK